MATQITDTTTSKTNFPIYLNKIAANDRVVLFGIFIFVALLMLFYRPFSQLEGGDSAIYDYIAQAILRGQLPYRDVVDIKGPMSVYLSAISLVIGRLFGLHDVISIRLFHVLMTGLCAALIYRVAVVYLRRRIVGVMAAILPFITPAIPEVLIGGTQPKLPMIIFGLLTLLLIERDRPFLSGVFGMLACLCWQPGLMYVGTAFLIFSKYLTSWRDWRALKLIAGALLPVAVVVVYFYAVGILSDFWDYAFVYNYSVFGPEAKKPLADAGSHLWKITSRIYGKKMIFILMAFGGLVIYIAERLYVKYQKGWSFELFRDAIIFPAAVYLAFAFINFQAVPDLIPFLPFIGLFGAWLVIKAAEWLSFLVPVKWASLPSQVERWMPISALAGIIVLVLLPGLGYRLGEVTLAKQIEEVNEIAAHLQPEDKVYTHGTIGMLVLMNRPNMNAYVFLDWNMDSFIAKRKYGGSFAAVIEEMEAQKPKLVGISRLRAVTHSEKFENWVRAHYDELPLRINKGVYLRKPD
ncbi:MAG: DolP-mannose mannosyltransferase [Acidobacteriota bacterium]